MFRYIAVVFLILSFSMPSFSKPLDEVYGKVSDGQIIFYSYRTNKWYYQRPKQRKKNVLEVVRYETNTPEAYSEYVSDSGKVYAPAGSDYEFLYKGRLITYHIYDEKFYEIIYNKQNKSFIEVMLEEKEIKKFLGNPKIIRISEFDKYNKIVVTKLPLKRQYYLILNDTDKYFYRYMLNIPTKDRNIRTLFNVKSPITVLYHHYVYDRDVFPVYEIKIRNGFK